ncbi:MAG: TIGR03013 family PEP-CTERM/XrtA system glycosyltransferase, partial [Betaproteobacteria bacterium]
MSTQVQASAAVIYMFSHYVPARVVVLAVLEGLLLLAAAYIGIIVHQSSGAGAVTHTAEVLPVQVALFVLGMIVLLAAMGLYHPNQWANRRYFVIRLAASFLIALIIMQALAQAVPMPLPDTFTIAATLSVALAGGVALRAAINEWSSSSVFKSRVLVLGTGSRALKVEEHAHDNPQHEIVGYVSLKPTADSVPRTRILTIAEGETLDSIVERYAIDKIVVAVRDRRGGALPVEQLLECKARGIRVLELSNFFESEYRQLLLESLNTSWMALGDGFRRDRISNLVKRIFDLGASVVLLFLTLPIMILTALCIRLEDSGPVLFRQERVGRDGRIFELLKFRSMRTDAECGGKPQWARANDDRVTRVGRLIRKLRIDELPQVLNVIRGDMSFVGPRPERPFFVGRLTGQIPYYALRHSVRPGITGWAQVRYPYGATVDDAVEKLQYDL